MEPKDQDDAERVGQEYVQGMDEDDTGRRFRRVINAVVRSSMIARSKDGFLFGFNNN